MYNRRKVLLALLQCFDNKLDKIRLQKLLFLLTETQKDTRAYHFIPYKYGCFSFQANADLNTLCKYGIVEENEREWVKTDNVDYIAVLKNSDHKALIFIRKFYGHLEPDQLIRLTYRKFPYYTINSKIAHQHLSNDEIACLPDFSSGAQSRILFTIGYEGISLEEYINRLIKNNVRVLCDVRKNALSMKYGFSKRQLVNACTGTGITYTHFPQVGIQSNRRKNLNSQQAYDTLFLDYKKTNLTSTIDVQRNILTVLQKSRRIALTCFESNINQCHRKHLADSLYKLSNFQFKIRHI